MVISEGKKLVCLFFGNRRSECSVNGFSLGCESVSEKNFEVFQDFKKKRMYKIFVAAVSAVS